MGGEMRCICLPTRSGYTIEEIRSEGVDVDFNYELPLDESYYVYKVEFEVRDTDYKVVIDSRDGRVIRIRMDD